jgi:hypothetical protein
MRKNFVVFAARSNLFTASSFYFLSVFVILMCPSGRDFFDVFCERGNWHNLGTTLQRNGVFFGGDKIHTKLRFFSFFIRKNKFLKNK